MSTNGTTKDASAGEESVPEAKSTPVNITKKSAVALKPADETRVPPTHPPPMTGTKKRFTPNFSYSSGPSTSKTGPRHRFRPQALSIDMKPWTKLLQSTEDLEEMERIRVLGEKFCELNAENKRIGRVLDQREKEKNILQRERDYLKADCNKNILAKNKLENICRELQRQNKQIRDENVVKLREEESRRKLAAADLNEKLNDISTMMENASMNTLDLQKDNKDMQLKLIQLTSTLKERSDHLEEMKNEVDLQKKLSDAIVAKLERERFLEKEMWEKERNEMFENLKKSEENCTKLQKSLNEFQDKYKGIEETMSRSNELFGSFKSDFQEMSSKIRTLEKEANDWKIKFYSNTNAMVELTEENNDLKQNLYRQQQKVDRLETLCRRLVNERSIYLKQLKDFDIAIPTVENPTPEVAAEMADFLSASKIQIKEEELAHLKKRLSVLKASVPPVEMPSTSGEAKNKKNKKKKNKTDKNKNQSPKDIPENELHNVPEEVQENVPNDD